MKKLMTALMALMLLLPALALAAGPVLLVELPEDALMVENIEFEDGDFIQTYQMGGAQVQLLRYASFDMTVEELAMSDWAGAQNVLPMEMTRVGNFPMSGVTLTYAEEGQEPLDVTLALVDAGAYTLVFSAVVPQDADEAVHAQIDALVKTMQVYSEELGGEGEVG